MVGSSRGRAGGGASAAPPAWARPAVRAAAPAL